MMSGWTAILLMCSPASSRASESVPQESPFQKLGVVLDPWAESQVRFWKRIYSEYTSDDWLVHDTMNPARVYASFRSEAAARAGRIRVQALLRALAESPSGRVSGEGLAPEAFRIFEAMEANEDPRAYRFAAEDSRLRIQSGRKNGVEEAFGISKPYRKRMREMFREEGVPEELALLPFVESAFNHEARSRSGATGIWQFMPKTAATELRVGAAIDERYDPLKSTRAAARFLKMNHRLLGNWALAVMAYHHGAGLVKKAKTSLRTDDPVRIIRIFKDPAFRFASRNYLFEFLAMCEVQRERSGGRPAEGEDALPPYLSLRFPRGLKVGKIAKHYGLNLETLKSLNPHFRMPIWKNEVEIPAHYPVRVAGITLEEFRKLQYP